MNHRQRFLETMTFGIPDRPASGDYFYYDSTRERWEREGLPRGVDISDYFDMDFDPFHWNVPVTSSIMPGFEEKVLEDTEKYLICRKKGGEIVRLLKNTPPPCTTQWLKYPLESRDDWDDYKRRLDPDTPGRLPNDFETLVKKYGQRDYPLGMWIGSSYGYMRNWWGVERLSTLFYDDPGIVEEMIEYLAYLSVGLLERVFSYGVELDWVMFWEDLAYKGGPLLSPAFFKKFCLPYYAAVMEKVREADIPVVMVDSDGDIRQIIPLWLEMGVKVMHPMEVASGMDVVEIRRQYGRQVGFFGGIDKRALAGTKDEIRREVLPKLEVCFAEGGFIPACDHGIPPDVSFDNYCYFRDLVRKAADKV